MKNWSWQIHILMFFQNGYSAPIFTFAKAKLIHPISHKEAGNKYAQQKLRNGNQYFFIFCRSRLALRRSFFA